MQRYTQNTEDTTGAMGPIGATWSSSLLLNQQQTVAAVGLTLTCQQRSGPHTSANSPYLRFFLALQVEDRTGGNLRHTMIPTATSRNPASSSER